MEEMGPLTADTFDVRMLTKQTGRPLLTPDTSLDLTPDDIKTLNGLERGGQAIFRSGRVVTVRVLRSKLGQYWAVAATRPVVQERAAWIVPTAWLGVTIAALLLVTAARRVTEPTADALSPPPLETV